jgi:E3 ubiquitin-protein ligase RNF5
METSPLNEKNSVPSYSESNDQEYSFICNVCLDIPADPIVTQCGHLYCWPCIFRWLNTQHNVCPVCKAGVSRENIIPIFIKGSEEDPRNKYPQMDGIPNRPVGHRPPEPQTQGQNPQLFINGNIQGGNLAFSAGFGFFPSLFGLQFQTLSAIPSHQPITVEEIQQANLSKALIALGTVVVLALILF